MRKQSWADRVGREIDDGTARVLIAAGIGLTSEHQKDLGKQWPPSSVEGEYPARRTGNLQSAVSWEPQTVSQVAKEQEVRVGYRKKAHYIKWLVEKGRLWLRDTANRIKNRLGRRRR